MTIAEASLSGPAETDPVSDVLKWVLLLTAIISFILLFWGTLKTYEAAPSPPENSIIRWSGSDDSL